MLKFTSDPRDLRKLLGQYELASIPIDEEARKYLCKVVINIVADNSQGKRVYSKNLFWQLICLCGYIKIDQDAFESLLVGINKFANVEALDRYYQEITHLLIAANQENLLSKKAKETIENILKKDLEQIAKEKNPSSHVELTQELASCCDNIDNNFESEINDLINNQKIDTVVDIYQCCSEEIQKKIREIQGIDDLVPTVKGYINYLMLVQKNIVTMKEDANNQIIKWLKKQQKNKKHAKDINDVILAYCNLILVNPQAIKDKEKIVRIIKDSTSEISKWLTDVDGFDYSAFELNWLSQCYGGLLAKLAEKPIVRENVAKEVKKQFLNKTLDDQILKIYMKYFV